MLIKKSKKAVCFAVTLVLLMSMVFALPHLGAEEPESGTASPAEELASEETIELFSEEVSPVEELLETRTEPEVILPETEEEIPGAALESEGEALTETAGDIALLAEESENTEEDEAIYVVASTLQCSTDGHGSITDWMLKCDANHDGKVDGLKSANGQGYLSDYNTDAGILAGVIQYLVTAPHMESADVNGDGIIDSFDWGLLEDALKGVAGYPSAWYRFRAVDTPATGYHFASATVNGVTLTQENPDNGNYHLTLDENGTATVTGLSLAENSVYFTHEPNGEYQRDVLCILSTSTDGYGSITDWMLKGDANHDGVVDVKSNKVRIKDSDFIYQNEGSIYISAFDNDLGCLWPAVYTLPYDDVHVESADLTGDGRIQTADVSAFIHLWNETLTLPVDKFSFRAVDTPNAGYHFASATVNGVTLTQKNSDNGNYHLTLDENGTATVTGLSLAENSVYFTHEPDSSPSDPEPCVKTFITLTSDCDENGSITDWMLKGDADHDGSVVGVDHINEELSNFESVDGYEQTDLYKISAHIIDIPINPFHHESADVDGAGGINSVDVSHLARLGTLNAGLSQLNEMFVFRVTDTPNSGYRVARVTVNGVVLTPDAPNSGSYHLEINENGIATITGQSEPANTVYLTHEPDGSEPVIPPLSGCKIRIPFTKTILGDDAPKEEFAFKIAALTEGAPMPAEDTVLMGGAGNGRFLEISYSSVGRYEYSITEVPGSAVGYTYDSSVYTVTVEVTNAENGGLKATIVKIVKDGGSDKLDKVIFENKYTAPQPKYGSLRISKTVTGELADKSVQFTFHIVLSDTFYNENGFANGEKDITLKHGENITISHIPAGTTYTITERRSEAYTTTVDNNGTLVSGKEVSGTITADTEAAVAYTNDLPYTPVVGIHTDAVPFILLGFMGLSLMACVAFKKRKSLGK